MARSDISQQRVSVKNFPYGLVMTDTTNYLNYGNSSDFAPDEAITLELNFMFLDDFDVSHDLFSRATGCYQLAVVNGQLVWSVTYGSGVTADSTGLYLERGQDYHIVVTADATEMRCIVNGVLISTIDAGTGGIATVSAHTRIGRRSSANSATTGIYGVHRLWFNQAITTAEAQELYFNNVVPQRDSLRIEGLLTEGSGSSVNNEIAGYSDGTIVGATWTTITPSKTRTNTTGEQNLIPSSENANDWVTTTVEVTANATTAPDGEMTADHIAGNTDTGYHNTYETGVNVNLGKPATFSIYVQEAEYTKFILADSGHGTFSVAFDLVAETYTVIASSAYIYAKMTDEGDGWWRCSVTFNVLWTNLASTFSPYPDSGATLTPYGAQYTGDGTSGMYAWGMQVTQNNWVTPYVKTTGTVVNTGVRRNITPLGQNLFEYTDDLTDSLYWTMNTSFTVTPNQATNPVTGELTAYKIAATSTPAVPTKSIVATHYAPITFTMCGKNVDFTAMSSIIRNTTTSTNLISRSYSASAVGEAITAYSRTKTEDLGDGWYRVTLTVFPGGTTFTSGDNMTYYFGVAGGQDEGAYGYICEPQLTHSNWPGPRIPPQTAAFNEGNIRSTVL